MKMVAIAFVVIMAVALPVAGQVQEALIYCCAEVSGTYDGTSVQLHVVVNAAQISFEGRLDEIVGLELYRATAEDCGTPVRITAAPIPWSRNTPIDQFITDYTAEPGHLYHYRVVAVDRFWQPIGLQWGWGFEIQGWVRTGNVPIAHGTVDNDEGVTAVRNCAGECLLGGTTGALPHHLRRYINTETPLLLYGYIGGAHPQFGWSMLIVDGRPAECVVGVEASAWGHVKQLYR